MVEPTVVAAIAVAGAVLFAVVGGLAGAALRWYRQRRPAPTAPHSVATVSAAPVAAGRPASPAAAVRPAAASTLPAAAPSAAAPPAAPSAATPAGPARADVTTRLASGLRRHPWARRSLTVAALAMAATGVGVLAYPAVTDVVQARIQTRLEHQLASPQFRQVYLAGRVEEGDSVTRLRIPSIGVDTVVVEGTTESALRAGAGHYPSTPLPCQEGNVGIAGHRTTYGHPFRNLDQLGVGDEIVLDTPVGTCTYRVAEAPFPVAPTATSVVAPTDASLLTLTTCHPVGSAAQRLVVRAELVASDGAVA
ncbi:MAG TPA: class E sortase [Acidimicrobiales bacterium]|jgi:sortase A